MAWANEIFQPRHGEVGVAAASALVSGLGNLGSILTTYALYTGWPADAQAKHKYRKSNLVMVGILVASVLAAGVMAVGVRWSARRGAGRAAGAGEGEGVVVDAAAVREEKQRGLGFGRKR